MEVSRRTFARLVAAGGIPSAAGVLAGCGGEDGDRRPGMGRPMSPGMGSPGTGSPGMPGWMMEPGSMDAQLRRDMQVIHQLLVSHEEIRREVEDIPGGIRSVTASQDPDVAEQIVTHVWRMKARIEDGHPIRRMDPLFQEIFEHREDVSMAIEEVSGGVRVTETSSDPQVELLIRQHAHRAVSEFVASGMRRAMRPTPLPRGYRG